MFLFFVIKMEDIIFQIYRYSEGFSKHHVAAFFERSVLKEVRILSYLHNNSTMLIPKFQNKIKLQVLFKKALFIFVWIWRNFKEHLFWKTSSNDCFCMQYLYTKCLQKYLPFKLKEKFENWNWNISLLASSTVLFTSNLRVGHEIFILTYG